ncbi:hypothetical protein AB0442_06155 [Kitasatospora sp. NPDC085895]|uniref:hypothetical protein n=1 Tax=Kitasatospora sp. NPDC085895 TaxID=3155057 RepID=UPI00344E29EE
MEAAVRRAPLTGPRSGGRPQLAVGGETVAGYLDAGNGRLHAFFAGVDNTRAADVDDFLEVVDDVTNVAALLQQQAARHPHH